MAAATSYATHAMAHPAGQWAILALLSLHRVCLPSYAVPNENPTGSGFSENPKLICCKIYISESRNKSALDKIDEAARTDPENVVVLSKFGDHFYNRVRYTLVSYISKSQWTYSNEGNISKLTLEVSSPIRAVLSRMVNAALTLSLESHKGTHPTIGIIDDLSFHPLGEAKMEDAVYLAKDVASDIAGSKVPVFLYAEAHPERKTLGAVRHDLGYYKNRRNDEDGQWSGVVKLNITKTKPHVCLTGNHDEVLPKIGGTTVGATPFLEGYNVPVHCKNISKVEAIVKKLKERLGGRGGEGPPKLLALALCHGSYVEVGCLLDPNHLRADQVQDMVKQIAAEQGLEDKVEKGYYTDITKDMILINLSKALFEKKISKAGAASDVCKEPEGENELLKAAK
ncbi:unnamed protein product [Urochloa decumbens]|uniref:Formiminotransferase N-terminal subdomain domain-containing protein n=1 Tax=Urochloa decumbens TaxID=240449 RepID=A0ABC9BBX8_9POAL